MSCITPPVHPNPIIHNKVIEGLQADLAAGCNWITQIFPLAEVTEREIDGQKVLVPAVYGQQQEGQNNYIELFPDGRERAISFFELPNGDYDVDRINDTFQFTIKVIVTAQLNLLADRSYDFTDELMASCYEAFNTGTYSNEITNIRMVRDRNQVFNKYGYNMSQFFSFMYPKTAFALELTMNIPNEFCITPFSFNESYSPEC